MKERKASIHIDSRHKDCGTKPPLITLGDSHRISGLQATSGAIHKAYIFMYLFHSFRRQRPVYWTSQKQIDLRKHRFIGAISFTHLLRYQSPSWTGLFSLNRSANPLIAPKFGRRVAPHLGSTQKLAIKDHPAL